MNLLPWTTLAASVVGDDLYLSEVSGGLAGLGARSKPVAMLGGFLSMSVDEARRAIGDAAGKGARLILVVPTSWCAVRPVPFDADGWRNAREGIIASIDQLVPVSSVEAMVGVLSVGSVSGGKRGGYLLVARRPVVQAWLERLSSVTGVAVSGVLAAPMALLGLGLSRVPEARVRDELAEGMRVRHVLRYGEPVALCEPESALDEPIDGMELALPESEGGQGIGGHELAVSAALAERAGAGWFVPLEGRGVRGAPRWLAAAAAVVLACAALLGAKFVSDGRYESAIEDLAIERKQHEAAQKAAESDRAEARRLCALIDKGFNAQVKQWGSILPALASAQAAVGKDGFVYWVKLDTGGVEMRGEAKQSADVLRAMESSASLFSRARLTDPPSGVPERGLETFTVKAEAKQAPGGEGTP